MRIIASINSDIGTALAKDWLLSGHKVWGTYRNWNQNCDELQKLGAQLQICDVTSSRSINLAIGSLPRRFDWEVLVISVGDQKPIGLFADIAFPDWAESIQVNLVGPLEILHYFMQFPNPKKIERTVILFAGGATNRAIERYSAYTISKIASIKICELLDFEYPEYKFTCIGPGWVKTKIHSSTLDAGEAAGENYKKTIDMIDGELTNPVSNVIEHCNWVVLSEKSVVGGRNFSTVYDSWRDEKLAKKLVTDPDFYKLRRLGNDYVV